MPRSAEYYREYRKRRKDAGKPVKSGRHGAEYFRDYRAQRRENGLPLPTGAQRKRAAFDGFVAWDGEGVTTEKPSGMDPYEWRRMVEARGRALYESRLIAYDRLCDVRIIPDMIRTREGWRRRGEFADVPDRFLEPNRRQATADGERVGNLDQVADRLGMDAGELLDALRDLRRPTLAGCKKEIERAERAQRPRPGKHVYTLLANSRGGAIENAGGLHTKECFDFLLAEAAKYPNAKHAIFAGSYDVNMMLGDLDRETILQIATGAYVDVRLGGALYRVHYRPRKFLFLARWGSPMYTGSAGGKRRPNYTAKLALWDVFGFFQAAFVKALTDFKIDAPIEAIAAMKNKRAEFGSADADAVKAYCIQECSALEDLCNVFYEHTLEANLRLTRFDGAGAAAIALLDREQVKAHKGTRDDRVDVAIRTAYAGGRIEIAQIGTGELYDLDINSAYPSIAAGLPTGVGIWRHNELSEFYLARVRFSFPEGLPWYPFFYRLTTGGVQFPSAGEGWYWNCELEAAQEFAAECGGVVDVLETWAYVPESDVKPFAFVPEMYAQRRAWKREGRGAQQILKLCLNSLYGKTCQQLGASRDREPPYFNLAWAGMITAGTRARLTRAGVRAPESVVMFATDGIFTTEPLDMQLSDELGAWNDGGHSDRAVVAQAGVYWWHENDAWKARYRGFDKESAPTPEKVLNAWRKGARSIVLPTTRFVTFGSALMSDELWPYWRTWRTVDRILKIDGLSLKRCGMARAAKPYERFERLNVAPAIGIGCSTPYETFYSAWGESDTDPETVDGVPDRIFAREVDDSMA